MTLFEYLAVAFSLVLSFSATRLLAGFSHAARPDRRYWVHFTFVVCQFLGTTLAFWNIWSFREATWTLHTFAITLAIPSSLFFVSCALIPEQPSAIDSWHTYYFAARKRIFAGYTAVSLAIFLATALVLDVPLLHPMHTTQLLGLSVGLVGFSLQGERVHAALALVALGMQAIAWLAVFVLPGTPS